ncbi:MAG: TadE/TadG family protein [Acidimicrobiia bacterium]|nr:MAG: TadE/TadG family protein [Acidimicrobiia bacterium]
MKQLLLMKRRLENDDGAILILAAVLLIILFGVAALAVDITLKSTDRQQLWNSSDAAALAGASQLPNGLLAESVALDFALDNDGDLAGNVTTTFRCLVGDRNKDGQPDATEVPAVCDPGADVPASGPPWVCADGICTAPCVPADGDTCNTIVLGTEKTTDFAFAPAIGIDEGTTDIVSAACRGSCGAGLTGPVDLILVLDRSGSMTNAGEVPVGSPNDMDQVERASLAVLDFFDPAVQHVGLAVLPAADKLDECDNASVIADGRFLVVPLSNDYKDTLNYDFDGDGTDDVDSTSELVNIIRCSTDGGNTDLGGPIRDSAGTTTEVGDDAITELLNNGRPGVKKGILFLSDGGANHPPSVAHPCEYAGIQATAAKNQGIEIFTIGFGVDNLTAPGRMVHCDRDEAGPYGQVLFPPDGAPVTALLAAMATQPADNRCSVGTTDYENTDDDYFFCIPKDEDLSDVFLAVATQFAQGSRLVQLPPGG